MYVPRDAKLGSCHQHPISLHLADVAALILSSCVVAKVVTCGERMIDPTVSTLVFERFTHKSCQFAIWLAVLWLPHSLDQFPVPSSLHHCLHVKIKKHFTSVPPSNAPFSTKFVLNFSKANVMPPIRAPEPSRTFFDPFNSSSTGHQRAENRLSVSTSWRDSRSKKLAQQFRDTSGGGGETHLTDQVGAESENFGKDGRKENGSREVGAPGLRKQGWQDIRGLVGVSKKRKSEKVVEIHHQGHKKRKDEEEDIHPTESHTQSLSSTQILLKLPGLVPCSDTNSLPNPVPEAAPSLPQIFRFLTLYLNGSTHSSGISDHKLKSLFVQHGGSVSIALGRRTVTHVILGSEGGGLAAGKIQKEVAKVAGKSVRFVTANWVVDSVECKKRQPEGKYQAVHTALKGQRSVLWKSGSTSREHSERNEERL
jgi:BRCT domain, a BRCA1 C-terminus domain